MRHGMGPDMFHCVPRVSHLSFPPSSRPVKPAEGPGTGLGTTERAPSPTSGRTARGKKLFRYFSTFLTYLVKTAEELIRIMSNSGASTHLTARVNSSKAELLYQAWHSLLGLSLHHS